MKKLFHPTQSIHRRFKLGSKLGLKSGGESGFALIATISVMVLLVMIALAMLSLSTIELRASQNSRAMAEAQGNARMALMLAIGELQKSMGPDQRISANAEILSLDDKGAEALVVNPHWTGVWDSWQAGTGEKSQHSTIGETGEMAPTYETNRSDYFRGWLLSLNSDDLDPDNALNVTLPINLTLDGKLTPAMADTDIRLVGEGSLGVAREKDYVSARLLSVTDPTNPSKTVGRYGWWIGDESQKARLLSDSYQNGTLTAAEKIFRSQAPASMGNKTTPGLESITDEEELDKLPSLKTLDLIGLDTPTADDAPTVSQRNFHNSTIYSQGILADVREGGLKRDLSTILERPIDRSESGNEFMLYAFDDPRFTDRAHSRVPIQDLAAYFQLYNNFTPSDSDFGVKGREGVRYNSTDLADSIQLSVPDYDGGSKDRSRVINEYTTLYRQPVLTKVQYLFAVTAEKITDAHRQNIQNQVDGTNGMDSNRATMPIRPEDTHKLRVGVMPMVTLWNPTNLPMVMSAEQIMRIHNPPPIIVRWRKYRGSATDTFESVRPVGLHFFTFGHNKHVDGRSGGFDFLALSLKGDGGKSIVFEPGEVKILSLAESVGVKINEEGNGKSFSKQDAVYQTANIPYDPFNFIKLRHSSNFKQSTDQPDVFVFSDNAGNMQDSSIVFNKNDRFSLWIDHDNVNSNWYAYSQNVARGANINNAAFATSIIDPGYYKSWTDRTRFLMHYAMLSRHAGGSDNNDPVHQQMAEFNEQLITPGFPGGVTPIDYDGYTNAIKGSQLIGASNEDEAIGMFEFSLSLGCEVGTNASGGFGGGRRIASRPFLHSAAGAPPFIDQSDDASLYNYGWDWQLGTVNNVEDSIVRGVPGQDNGYYGGGYTSETGTTHVIQREIPVLPPISIASLSHAQLGGFSLSNAVNYEGVDPETGTMYHKGASMSMPHGVSFQMTTATGQGGLAPHIMQATGNSYAHPNLPANKAFTTKARLFDQDEGPKEVPFVDHSYLANKALWDEFFFSSMAPQPSKVPLFESANRTAKQVADDFFFNDKPLPNRRINPYKGYLNQAALDTLFTEASTYTNGLADKIAAHLMVDGAFNINSTSVDAWKVFLSSLKGKPVAYLDGGATPQEAVAEGTTFSPGSLSNAVPIKTAEITGPNLPPQQWKAGRELSEGEISELAYAIVRQVKQRGPFLSLSEFINRRLDGSDTEKSLKGALQAALDDPNYPPKDLKDSDGNLVNADPGNEDGVEINASFRRTLGRMLDSETASITGFEFPDAAKGPIAYGSAPYVDQADVLRHFSEQITPRGDTFVIRTYGDSIDGSGEIVARAWCEAVVQRTPDYVDSGDEAYKKQSELSSETNKIFGRQFKIISFRWLNSDEV